MLGSSPGNPAAAAWAANLLCPGTLEAALVQQSHTIEIIRSSHLGIKVSGYCRSRSLLEAEEYIWKRRNAMASYAFWGLSTLLVCEDSLIAPKQ